MVSTIFYFFIFSEVRNLSIVEKTNGQIKADVIYNLFLIDIFVVLNCITSVWFRLFLFLYDQVIFLQKLLCVILLQMLRLKLFMQIYLNSWVIERTLRIMKQRLIFEDIWKEKNRCLYGDGYLLSFIILKTSNKSQWYIFFNYKAKYVCSKKKIATSITNKSRKFSWLTLKQIISISRRMNRLSDS